MYILNKMQDAEIFMATAKPSTHSFIALANPLMYLLHQVTFSSYSLAPGIVLTERLTVNLCFRGSEVTQESWSHQGPPGHGLTVKDFIPSSQFDFCRHCFLSEGPVSPHNQVHCTLLLRCLLLFLILNPLARDKAVHLVHLVSRVLRVRGAQLETKAPQDLQDVQPSHHSN